MTRPVVVNHVMSRDIESGIFSAILSYFRQYSPQDISYVTSVEPIDGADVYHYHRPHLEERLKPNSVCTVHHDLNDPDPSHRFDRFLPRYREAGMIVCLNTTQMIILHDAGIPLEKLAVACHGYNHRLLRAKPYPAPANGPVTLGVVSRRYGRRVKGEAYLLELAKRLDPQAFSFLFVGQDRSIDAEAMRALGFAATVFERLPYTMFQGLYNAMDALLMCSTHEGGPANIPEALGTGTPVFSSEVGMSADMLIPGVNGHFLTLDPDTDAAMLTHLCVTDPDLFSRLRRSAGVRASVTPTWELSIQRNVDVYRSLLSSRTRPDWHAVASPLSHSSDLEGIAA